MTPLVSIVGGGDQEIVMPVELRLNPDNPRGGELGARRHKILLQLNFNGVLNLIEEHTTYLPEMC